MRRSTTAVLLLVACLSGAGEAAAQTAAPPPPPPAAPPPAAAAPAPPPAAAAPAPEPAPATPPPPPPAAAPAAPAPAAAPAAAPGNWWDKFAVDAFADAYGNINWNFPAPQWPQGTPVRAYDLAQGFALNQIGLNAAYSSDTVGGTVSLRFGPEAYLYNLPATAYFAAGAMAVGQGSTADNSFGMQNVRQAYATLHLGSVTLDLGKWDQPFGSEVPDSQLNFFYTRSLLFQLNQPVFFTGLRFDFSPSSNFDLKLFAANGWNETIDNNASKTFGLQVMLKPADVFQIYIGGAAGPEQPDFVPVAAPQPTANSGTTGAFQDTSGHWREIGDLVVDFNPTSALSFALNADIDHEDKFAGSTFDETWWGVNLGIKYVVADPFAVALRGEIFGDNNSLIVGGPAGQSTTIESATLTLSSVVASHLTLMLDNRIDIANNPIFASATQTNAFAKAQFTTTLGAIIATK